MKQFMACLFAFAITGCAVDDVDTDTDVSDIVGGTVDTTHHPEIFKLHVAGVDCTATLMSASTFIATGRCINYVYTTRAPGTATFLDGSTRATGLLLGLSNTTGSNDLVFGQLQTPVTFSFTPAAFSTYEPSSETLTILGNGCTVRTAGCSPAVRSYRTYFYSGQSSQYDSFGDFGAPTWVGGITDQGPIVRIASSWDSGTGNDIGADTVSHRPSILAYNTALQGSQIGYRGSMQNVLWADPAVGGGVLGVPGGGLRMEGIEVWSNVAGDHVFYQTAGQDYSWTSEASDGTYSGTFGLSKRLEAIKIRATKLVNGVNVAKTVTYRSYVHGVGWQDWVSNDAVSGTIGQSRAIEAIQVIFN
ncbi:MAG TPA: hypothetical protein VGM88_32670 [Kofleriaceae bacterium]|jgi:hypothetical protein